MHSLIVFLPSPLSECLFLSHRPPRRSSARRVSLSALGVQSDPEGSLWRDPPHYWEQIVWPAYVEAHTGLFAAGDLARGAPAPVAPSTSAAVLDGDSVPHDGGPVKDLVVVEALEHSMGEIVDLACALLQKAVEASRQP
jgi:nicotinamide/nicotinate riboside kinase